METFTKARRFGENSGFDHDRQRSVAALDLTSIDEPIKDIVAGFSILPHCFTLQCCYGHFLCAPDQDPNNFEPIPLGYSGLVRYRIAYFAFCLENSDRGRELQQALARIPAVDSDYIQFGSADWFWERWVNSFALQVQSTAHMMKDEAVLDWNEAQHVQEVRGLFFDELRVLLAAELKKSGDE